MKKPALITCIVAVELLMIGALAAYLMQGRGIAASVTPFSRDDITSASSSLRFYYDLATEAKTSVPEWLPYEPEYLRNSDQLNDRFDYSREKQKGTYRIITLGDSWGFGMHVSTKDNYSERLEDLLNNAVYDGMLACADITKFEVLNFGVGGYDIEYMIERLRLRGMKYDPDLIIPIVKPDDFLLVNEIFRSISQPLYEEYGDLTAKTVGGIAKNPRQEISERVEREIFETHTHDELDAYSARALASLSSFYDKSVLFFVYGKLSDSEEDILREFSRRHGATHIFDSTEMLAPHEKVPHDEHPGITGHARFAREIFEFMILDSVIPCHV